MMMMMMNLIGVVGRGGGGIKEVVKMCIIVNDFLVTADHLILSIKVVHHLLKWK